MTVLGLTPKQHAALKYIEEHNAVHGYAPSCREIMRAVGLRSTSGVFRLMNGLEERGHIVKHPDRWRSVAVRPEARAV